MFVNTLREMVSIELGKEIEKDVFRLVTSVWRNKKILSPHEESNLRPSDSALRCSTIEPQRPSGERGLLEIDVHIFVRSEDIYRRGYLSDDIKIFKRDSQLICLYGAIDQNLWEHNVLISS